QDGVTLVRQQLTQSVGHVGSTYFGSSLPHQDELFRLELERRRVDAVAQAGRLRAVVEDVAQVATAIAALHFGAAHAVAAVRFRLDGFLLGRGVEARPARTRVELLVRAEQNLATTSASI